jgi:hypothetical protein
LVTFQHVNLCDRTSTTTGGEVFRFSVLGSTSTECMQLQRHARTHRGRGNRAGITRDTPAAGAWRLRGKQQPSGVAIAMGRSTSIGLGLTSFQRDVHMPAGRYGGDSIPSIQPATAH